MVEQCKENNACLTRWSLELQPYQFVVEHRQGRANANADALSRIDWQVCCTHEKEGGDVEEPPTGSFEARKELACQMSRSSCEPPTSIKKTSCPPNSSCSSPFIELHSRYNRSGPLTIARRLGSSRSMYYVICSYQLSMSSLVSYNFIVLYTVYVKLFSIIKHQ